MKNGTGDWLLKESLRSLRSPYQSVSTKAVMESRVVSADDMFMNVLKTVLYFNRSVYKLSKAYKYKPFFYKFLSIAPYLGVCVFPNFGFSDLEEKTGKNRQDAYLDFGVGAFDVFRENRETAFSLEYQPAHVWHTIRPVAGAMITTHLATYLHLGFAFSWVIGDVFLLSPGFSAGWYQTGKSGKDLGFPLE